MTRAARQATVAEILELLGREWPGLPQAVERASARGFDWRLCSTPFVHREQGRAVAHVGLVELPLFVAGVATRVAGIHGVVTDPGFRGRGHVRRLLEEALAFADARYPTVVLIAGEPEIYRRFGFEVVPEHRFVGPAPPRPPGAPPAVELRPDAPADRDLVDRLLRDRAPASRLLGVGRERQLFLFNTAGRPLRHAADLDALLVYRVAGTTLQLFDVVAERIPTLAEIVARVPEPVADVEVYLAPDALAAALEPQPWRVGGDEHLMARGPLLPAGARAFLPLTARC